MTKEAAQRSIMRRMVLTKAADSYSDMLNGYASSYRPGLVNAGVRVAVNDNLSKGVTHGPQQNPLGSTGRAPVLSVLKPTPLPKSDPYGLQQPFAKGSVPLPKSNPYGLQQPFAKGSVPATGSGMWGTSAGRAVGRGLEAVGRPIWRGIEWGVDWPTHLKTWWNRKFGG